MENPTSEKCRRHRGLVWSNAAAGDAVYLRAALLQPTFAWLLDAARRIGGILVVVPEELIAGKLIAFQCRHGTPKSGTDWRDLAVSLLAFPELKTKSGPIRQQLEAAAAEPAVIAAWESLVAQALKAEREEDEF